VGAGLGNYVITYVAGSLTVTKATLTVTANSTSKTYGQAVTLAASTFSTSGLLNGDKVTGVTLTCNGLAATAAATGSPYSIVPSAAVGTGLVNYNITYVAGSLTVNKAALTVTANSSSKTYGQTVTLSGSKYTTSGLLNSDTVTGATLTSPGAAATATVAGSPYTITPSAAVGAGLVNYNITYIAGSLTVNKAALTVTADSTSKTYGQSVTLSGTAFTTKGLVNSDTVTGATLTSPGAAATASVAGSPYPITPSAAVGTGLGNYNISYVAGSLTVNKATLTATVTAKSRSYDGTTTATVSGPLKGVIGKDLVSLVSTASFSDKNVGLNKVVTGLTLTGSGAANYKLSSTTVATTARITPAPLTINADRETKVYGQADPALTYKISKGILFSGDSLGGQLSRKPGEKPGTYAIQVGTLSAGGNYAIVFKGSTLAIAKDATTMALTASADPCTVGQGVTFKVVVSANPPVGIPSVPGAPTGTVQFFIDNKKFGGPIALGADGSATTTSVVWSTAGAHTISASYRGDKTFAGSSGTLGQTVSAAEIRAPLGGSLSPAAIRSLPTGDSIRSRTTDAALLALLD
jgi:hypothetical protein